jgi:hypothetical protein
LVRSYGEIEVVVVTGEGIGDKEQGWVALRITRDTSEVR